MAYFVSDLGPTSPDAYLQNIFLLLVTAALKFGLTAYTFGLKVSLWIIIYSHAPQADIHAFLGSGRYISAYDRNRRFYWSRYGIGSVGLTLDLSFHLSITCAM